MGNCMERSKQSQEVDRKQEGEEINEEKPGDGFVKESGFETGGIRIKLVLTKEELEWLMFELKGKNGRRLEDVLGEIERERGRERGKIHVGWKPSLERIMETPEVLEMDR